MFFATPADLWDWFTNNHESESELLVGFYKKDSASPALHGLNRWMWLVSAKKVETRTKRLGILIEDSANGRTIAQFTRRT